MSRKDIPIDLLDEPSHDVRFYRDPSFERLLERDIDKEGLLIPLLVRPKPDGRYEIIDGVTRKKDLARLGFSVVPCEIRECDDKDALIYSLKTGLKRKAIDAMGLAKSFLILKNRFGMRVIDIANRFDLSKGHVSKLLALNRLSVEDQDRLAKGDLTIEQAYSMIAHKPYSPRLDDDASKLHECASCHSRFPRHELFDMRLCFKCREDLFKARAMREKKERLERAQKTLV